MDKSNNADTKHMDESKQGEALMLESTNPSGNKRLYIESYGCAMNFADSEVVASILAKDGFSTTQNVEEADVILLNTCSIREMRKHAFGSDYMTLRSKRNHNRSWLLVFLAAWLNG